MINYNLNLILLGYQKYIPVHEFFQFFEITVNEYYEVINNFGRNIKNSKKYINSQYYKNKVLNKQIVKLLSNDKLNNKFDTIQQLFKLDSNYFINYIDFITKNNIFLSPFIFQDEKFYNFFKSSIDNNNKLSMSHPNQKLFYKNIKNTNLLIEQSNNMSIEEIALFWGTSPLIISKELIENRKGGYWENENIRINAPFFIDYNYNKYSTEELFYIIENINKNNNNILENLNTTLENYTFVKEIIHKILRVCSDIELKELICNNNLLLKNNMSNYIKLLKNIKKENSQFIFKYKIEDLFTLKDREELNNYFESLKNSILFKKHQCEKIKKKIIILKTEHKNYCGYYLKENSDYFEILMEENIVKKIKKKDVLYLNNL
ncbi:MAG: hypothetical protein GX287_05770 [Fusobacteria bacterium]|nr:hypothetical protein [Fusobacteriota bacterium]